MNEPMTKKGPNGSTLKQAGWITVRKDHNIRKSYECAAWYECVDVAAGQRVPLWFHGYFFTAGFDGVITGSNFTSRIGAHYGAARVDENNGKAGRAGIQYDAFGIAEIERGAGGTYEIELLPHWKVYKVGEYSSDGRPMFRIMQDWEIERRRANGCVADILVA